MKMDYKLYLSIIFAIAICFVLFLGYAYWMPNLPTEKDVLSNWITVLIFLVTISAGVMPFMFNDRQSRIENKLIEFEKNIESFTDLQKKVIDAQSGIDKINNNYPNIMPILQNMGNALDGVMVGIAQFYSDRLYDTHNRVLGKYSKLNAPEIKIILENVLNFLIAALNTDNKQIFISEYKKLQKYIINIKQYKISEEELNIAINEIQKNPDYSRILKAPEAWKNYLGKDWYPKFQELFSFILEE